MFEYTFDDSLFSFSEMSWNIDCATTYFSPNREYFLTYAEKNDYKIKPSDKIVYKLNNYGHRSDNFAPIDQDKTNILFAGCSSTFGEGIPEDTRWTNRVHNQFKDAGPLQVLGYPGAGADKLVSNIVKYCSQYGNPDYLFVMFADFSRHVEFLDRNGEKKFENVLMFNYGEKSISYKDNELETALFQFQNYYRILEAYCKSNNIKLYTSSWDSLTSQQMERLGFDTFRTMRFNEIEEYFFALDKEDLHGLDKKLYFLARDGHHDGTIRQRFVGDAFMKRVLDDKKD